MYLVLDFHELLAMKFRTFVTLFLIFSVLPDLYLLLVAFPDLAAGWKALLCLPSLVALLCLVFIGTGVRYTDSVRAFSYVSFLLELPKFLFSLVVLCSASKGGPTPHTVGLGLGVAVAVLLVFLGMIFGSSRHVLVNRMELAFPTLPPAFDGLTLCHLSDLHLGSFGQKAPYVRRVVDRVQELAPDLIVFTGDLVNFDPAEADSYRDVLAQLAAPLGVFSIRGNHDFLVYGCLKGEAREAAVERLLAFERQLGWRVLLNEHVVLEKGGDALALVGVDNVSANPFFNKMGGDLRKALEGLQAGIFKILLSHDPSHWRAEVLPQSDVDLTLSGHTHGLRFKLAGRKPSHWHLPESVGLYTEKGRMLYVSEGLGSAFAFRLSGCPKIDLITLRRSEAS